MGMVPAIGGCRPMRFFMRLDLPLPEPPRITTISPRCTSKDAPSSSTRAPYPMRRLRTLMTEEAMRARSARENGKQPVDHYHEHGAGDDGPGRCKTDRGCTRACRKTAMTTDLGNGQPEYRGLDQAEHQVLR